MYDKFFILIGIYYVFVLLVILRYYIIKNNHDDKTIMFYIIAISLLMPFFGVFFIMLFDYFSKKVKGHTIDDYEVSSFLKGEIKEHYLNLNIEKESNIVPIEEALLINNNITKRELLIDALKQDIISSASFLKKALNDNDTETSHYAAAALMELKNRLMTQLQAMSVKYETNKNDIDISIAYAEIIKKYIESGMQDEKSIKKDKYLYIHILNNINRLAPERKEYFVDRVNAEIELKEYIRASETCMLLMKYHRDSEEAYIMQLKLSFTLSDHYDFKRTLDNIRNSNIKLSYSALNKIRFWMDEV